MAPIILSPTSSSTTIRSYTDGPLFLMCTATAKPNLTESDFKWKQKGENIEDSEYASFTIDESALEYEPHGLVYQWTSTLTVAIPISVSICDSMERLNGNFRCIVQSEMSPDMAVETQHKCRGLPPLINYCLQLHYSSWWHSLLIVD